MTPTTTSDDRAAATRGTPLVPPDEQFWQRYSPHYEFPLSSVTSLIIHGLALAVLAMIVYVAGIYALDKERPVPVEPVFVQPGGGGSPTGVEGGQGTEDEPAQPIEVAQGNPDAPPQPQAPVSAVGKLDELPTADADPFVVLEMPKDAGGQVLASANEAIKRLEGVQSDVRKKLFSGLRDKGKGGPGSGGGQGGGTGTGRGSGVGPGDERKVTARQKRVLRWTMIFDTTSGADYANQLHALGAILAVPNPENPAEYIVYRNLVRRPVQGNVEDLEKIQRIYWVDDRPDSIQPLAMALGIRPPRHVVAFFPEGLEQKLLRLELDYGKRFGRTTEEQIQETKFRVRRVGGGRYEPYVEFQR